jgi:hypothetical protein
MMKKSIGYAVAAITSVGLLNIAHADVLPEVDKFDQEIDDLAVTQGVAQPTTIDRQEYQVWKSALKKSQRKKLDRFCTNHDKDYLRTCGGYGSLSIPMYPQLKLTGDNAMQPPTDQEILQWKSSLSPAQRKYLAPRCRRAERVMQSPKAGIGMEDKACQTEGTPLVLSFDGGPVEFSSGGTFSLQPGEPMSMTWPTARTPWVALDRNRNGKIDDGGELFGSGTIMPTGRFADNGFEALAVFDSNHDGVIDANDPVFSQLSLWADDNGDQLSQPHELSPLSHSVTSIALGFSITRRCDNTGSCEVERATMTWNDAKGALRTGAVVDVHLKFSR